ncbi:MAG TPA: hypothetical protein VK966_06110 [Longimicrobiales bacterium]|nr:hypothetical protein [Longimicrobiales bacterium]
MTDNWNDTNDTALAGVATATEERRAAEPTVYGGRPSGSDSPALAILAGLVAALVGGAIWAAVAIYGNLEVGWIAWGIGALVGGAMTRTTRIRSRQIALVAAVLALTGLAAGKAMTFAGSVGPVAEDMAEDDSYMRGMTAWAMYEDGTLDPALIDAVNATDARGDTLSDALWADMLTDADTRLAAMTQGEKVEMARASASEMMREMGLVNGVLLQLSLFDLLWVFLALATAYGMMARQESEPATA